MLLWTIFKLGFDDGSEEYFEMGYTWGEQWKNTLYDFGVNVGAWWYNRDHSYEAN